jgi:hypothetical protein
VPCRGFLNQWRWVPWVIRVTPKTPTFQLETLRTRGERVSEIPIFQLEYFVHLLCGKESIHREAPGIEALVIGVHLQ